MDTRPKVHLAEQVVLSDKHGVAGRLDMQAELRGLSGLTLVEAKTSSWIGATMHAQLVGYDGLAVESGFDESTNLRILQLREDGTYTLWPVFCTFDTFLNALNTYRDSGQINGQIRKFRDGGS